MKIPELITRWWPQSNGARIAASVVLLMLWPVVVVLFLRANPEFRASRWFGIGWKVGVALIGLILVIAMLSGGSNQQALQNELLSVQAQQKQNDADYSRQVWRNSGESFKGGITGNIPKVVDAVVHGHELDVQHSTRKAELKQREAKLTSELRR